MLDVVGPIHPLRTHPLRDRLVNEVHARPTMALEAPQSASHLAVVTGEHAASEIHGHLVLLCERHGVVPPTAGVDYFITDLGALQLRWERHTEFVTYTFFRRGGGEDPFTEPPIEAVPRDWLATLPVSTSAPTRTGAGVSGVTLFSSCMARILGPTPATRTRS
jgi:uncharacterized membrane-anchored protein